jgi:hypothetical protein
MERIKYNHQFNLIKSAIELLPLKVKPYLETVDFVFDYTPKYIGLHNSADTKDGRSYSNTCHCSYGYGNSDGKTTIVMFSENIGKYESVFDVIWHEIAHAIHEKLNFIKCDWEPITDYEIKNSKWDWFGCETFACSFTRWLYTNRNTDSWGGNQELQRKYDKRPIEFFNNLFGVN